MNLFHFSMLTISIPALIIPIGSSCNKFKFVAKNVLKAFFPNVP